MQPRDASGGRAGLEHPQGRRSFLFLQGPLSPLYARVADRLEAAGHAVSRINLSIGDRMHWRRAGAVDFRGRPNGFGDLVRQHMAAHVVTEQDRGDAAPACVGEPARLRQQLQRDPSNGALERLGDDPDLRSVGRERRRRHSHCRRRFDTRRGKEPARVELVDEPADRGIEVAVEHATGTLDRDRLDAFDPGRRSRGAEARRVGGKIRRRQLDDGLALRGLLVGPARELLGREILARRHERR